MHYHENERLDFKRRDFAWLVGRWVFAQQNLIGNGSFENGGQVGVQHFPGWDLIGPVRVLEREL